MIEDSATTKGSSSSGRRRKGKRSLFSVLFHSKSNKIEVDEDSNNNNINNNKDCKQEDKMNNNNKSLNGGDRLDAPGEQRRRPEVETDDEEDSYELDLDKRLEREKSKRNQRIQSAPPARQTPEGGSWCNNGNYIPRGGGQSSRSPLLEQFLSSHQIQFDSIDFSSSEDEIEQQQQQQQQQARQLGGKKANSSSEGDSLAERVARMMSGAGKARRPEVAQQRTTATRTSVDERDLRLMQWRLLASRTACSTSSLPSSDSELDLIDCQRPALAIACSDDTSCSSVELIWTRGSGNQGAATATSTCSNPPPQSHLVDDNNRFVQISRLPEPEAPRKLGLTRENAHLNALARYPRERLSAEPAAAAADKSTNFESSALGYPRSHRNFAQRLSIFELAKPSRARGKRFEASRKQPKGVVASPDEQWVANPLFSESDDQTLDRGPPDIRCASCESVIIGPKKHSNKGQTNDSFVSSSSSPSTDNDDSTRGARGPEEGKLVRKRWSMRAGRSPFNVSNHIMNLDRRIKSNVSSLKSQLSVRISDTGKRASMLADQLISSIKDTTKEQLFSGGVGKDDDSMLSNSFASNETDTAGKEPAATEKARLFSLIYKHQQQPNGQPVITRQPTATGALSSLSLNHHASSLDRKDLLSSSSPIQMVPPPPHSLESAENKPEAEVKEAREEEETKPRQDEELLALDKRQSESSSDMELLSLSRAGDDDEQVSLKTTSELNLEGPGKETHEDEPTAGKPQGEPTKQLEPTTSSNYNSIILSSGSSSSSSSTSEAIFHSDAFIEDDTIKDTADHQKVVGSASVTSAKETEGLRDGKEMARGTGKRRWRRRRQINVAMVSSEDDDDDHRDKGREESNLDEAEFFENELIKLTTNNSDNNSSQRQRPHRLRTLNYWRRLRSRASKSSINATKLKYANQSDF